MAVASLSALRPQILQSPTGTYGAVPPPSGTSSTGLLLSKPTFVSSRTGAFTPAPGLAPPPVNRPPAPAPSAPASGSAPPTGSGSAYAPRPANGQPAPTVPVNVNPIPTGGQQFQLPAPNAGGAPPSAPVASAVPRGNIPAGTTAVTADEVPYHVATGPSQGTTDVLSKLATEAGRQLDQPTIWDDPLAAQIKAARTAGVNANYDTAQRHLDASLADRGINYSTIAGGDIQDLEKSRAAELSNVDADIASQRANALAAGRQAAFGNATSYVGSQTGVDQTARANQVGERGYTDALRAEAQSQAQQGDTNFQNLLDRIYGYGTGAMGGAAGIYGGQAGMYGESQAADQQGLAQLAQLAAQFLGNRAAA